MKVKYLVGAVGPDLVIKPGDTRTVPDEEGKRLCESGACVPVRQSRAKKATVQAEEKR